MRENRPYGSEGGETGKPVFPTPIALEWHLIFHKMESIKAHDATSYWLQYGSVVPLGLTILRADP